MENTFILSLVSTGLTLLTGITIVFLQLEKRKLRHLNLKLEIALEELAEALVKAPEEIELDFTEDDLNSLRRMKIKVDD